MSPSLRLGLRLTVAGRSAVLRSMSTGVGSVIATVTLLGALTVADDHVLSVTSGEPLSATFRLFAVLVAVISLPVLVLVAVVSRLSATIRDRRLAILRLLGLSPRQTRGVAAVETAVMSAIGTIVGMAVFAGVVLPLLEAASVAGMPLLGGAGGPRPAVWVPVLSGVPLLTVLVSQAAMRGLADSPLAMAHRSDARRPRLVRLLPLLAGVSLTGWSTTWPAGREVVSATFQFTVSVSGILLNLVGLMLAVPLLVSGVAWLLALTTGRPSTLVAARRLQMEPASTTRLATGLLVGLFVVSGAQCVAAAFESAMNYQAERRQVLADPQIVTLAADRGTPGAETFADEVERRSLGSAHAAQMLGSPEGAPGPYVVALVTSCDLLEKALPGLEECSSTAPAWIRPPEHVMTTPIVVTTYATTGSGAPRLSLAPPRRALRWDRTEPTGPGSLSGADLFVPITHRGVESVVAASPVVQWAIATEPGLQASARIYRLHDQMFPRINNPWQQDTVRMIHGMRVIIWTVTAVVVLVGLAAFLIAAVDRAVERRREDASLHVLGARPTLVRSVQMQQLLVPLVFGVPSAVALGLLSGASLLAYGSALDATPWANASLLGVAATTVAVSAGLLTSAGLTRPVSPELLHRE